MKIDYKKSLPKLDLNTAHVLILKTNKDKVPGLSEDEATTVSKLLSNEKTAEINSGSRTIILVNTKLIENEEQARLCGHAIFESLKSSKSTIAIADNGYEFILALVEGIGLSAYQFLKYFKDKAKRTNKLKNLVVCGKKDLGVSLKELEWVMRAVYYSRDLVNEPVSYLTAPQLGLEIKKAAKIFGFKAQVFGRSKIESLKMGGLLAVNRGSLDDPSFSILEWKPAKTKNKKPIILVGKGVVYDTGGLSLKPTPNSMDLMKSDMGGSAAVIGAMSAVAANKLPLHVIALVPSTDNRPGGNAYAPGDVVTMYDGTTVEVLNTDAEGRMILADALAYAKKYKPELVIDAATLTGAAQRAIGKEGVVCMGNASKKEMDLMAKAGEEVYERIALFPFWDEYSEQLKSKIADLKNLGGSTAGAITAGKFLEHFTDYPYIHLDIAGPAFATSKWNYRGDGGTGVGVRLLYQFLKNKV